VFIASGFSKKRIRKIFISSGCENAQENPTIENSCFVWKGRIFYGYSEILVFDSDTISNCPLGSELSQKIQTDGILSEHHLRNTGALWNNKPEFQVSS
jgi:hypothetical protein